MPEYRVAFARSAEKEFANLPADMQKRAAKAIDRLASNPYHPGSKKLRGSQNVYRVRVGDYRIIYEVRSRERISDVARIRHRRDAYE